MQLYFFVQLVLCQAISLLNLVDSRQISLSYTDGAYARLSKFKGKRQL